jgi:hypothetical protein
MSGQIINMRKEIILITIFVLGMFIFSNTVNAGILIYDEKFNRGSFSPFWNTTGIMYLKGDSAYFNGTNQWGNFYRNLSTNVQPTDFTYSYKFYLEDIDGNGYIWLFLRNETGNEIRIKFYPYIATMRIDYQWGEFIDYQFNVSLYTKTWYQLDIVKDGNTTSLTILRPDGASNDTISVSDGSMGDFKITQVEHYLSCIGCTMKVRISNPLFKAGCFNIQSSGTYNFIEDTVKSSGDNCISINASNVILDLQNQTMWGCGIGNKIKCGNGNGIYSNGKNNVSVMNGQIVGFGGNNVYLNNMNGGLFYNIINTIGKFECHNCINMQISGSVFSTGDLSPYISGDSYWNIIGNSGFYNPYGMMTFWYTPPDAKPHGNLVCNIIYGVPPYKADYGVNNTYDDVCPATTLPITISPPCSGSFSEWECVANNTLAFVDVWCNYHNKTFCPYGCVAGGDNCNSKPVQTILNTTPYADIGLGLPAEAQWVNYFFTPAIIVCIFVFGIAGTVASKIGGGKKSAVFLIASALLFTVLSITGVLPTGILIIIGLGVLVAIGVAVKNKEETK